MFSTLLQQNMKCQMTAFDHREDGVPASECKQSRWLLSGVTVGEAAWQTQAWGHGLWGGVSVPSAAPSRGGSQGAHSCHSTRGRHCLVFSAQHQTKPRKLLSRSSAHSAFVRCGALWPGVVFRNGEDRKTGNYRQAFHEKHISRWVVCLVLSVTAQKMQKLLCSLLCRSVEVMVEKTLSLYTLLCSVVRNFTDRLILWVKYFMLVQRWISLEVG